MVVDDRVCTIGTANMDFRSFEQNFEVNAFLYDEEIARDVRLDFEEDQKDAYLVEYDMWMKRSRKQKAKESFARLFSPLL